MGSVYVTWKGTCRDKTLQNELVGFLRDLANRSAARLKGPAVARPAFLEMMTAQRDLDKPQVEPVRVFDHEITGRIIIDPCLAQDGHALHDDVQRTNTEMIAVKTGGMEKSEVFCLNLGSGGGQWCLSLPQLHLYGIDFQLFDPRRLYPNADRMSFIFLQNPELPSLDGCLAQIESHEQCQRYQSDVLRGADWYVSAPNIHLRYYLEEWSDLLLSWIKYFFIPDLYYRRYDELSQYEALRTVIEDNYREHGEDFAKQALFKFLIEKFEKEADEWAQKLSGMA